MKLSLLIFKLSKTDLKQVMWSSWSGLFFLRNIRSFVFNSESGNAISSWLCLSVQDLLAQRMTFALIKKSTF